MYGIVIMTMLSIVCLCLLGAFIDAEEEKENDNNH